MFIFELCAWPVLNVYRSKCDEPPSIVKKIFALSSLSKNIVFSQLAYFLIQADDSPEHTVSKWACNLRKKVFACCGPFAVLSCAALDFVVLLFQISPYILRSFFNIF